MSSSNPSFACCVISKVKPFLTPYYITIASLVGAATGGFVTLFLVLLLMESNFNVLGWME